MRRYTHARRSHTWNKPPFFSLASLSRTERQLRALPAASPSNGPKATRARSLGSFGVRGPDELVVSHSPRATASLSRAFHHVPHSLRARSNLLFLPSPHRREPRRAQTYQLSYGRGCLFSCLSRNIARTAECQYTTLSRTRSIRNQREKKTE